MKILMSLLLLLTVSHLSYANVSPNIPSFDSSSTNDLILKTKPNKKEVKKHGGYKVIDSSGNEFFVDDIKNPKHKVVITEIHNHSLGTINKEQIKQNVNIDKICFNLACK